MSSSTRIRAQDRFAHVSVAFSSRSKSRTESQKRGGYFPFPPCSIAETGPCLFLKKDLKIDLINRKDSHLLQQKS